MILSNQQIERYARQIIVPGVGGVAQERLLAAKMMLVGKAADVALVVYYLAGAGVGEIQLKLPSADAAEQDGLITGVARLNPDVAVKPVTGSVAGLNLVFVVSGGPETTELLPSARSLDPAVPVLFVQVNDPAGIAIFPQRPPCPICADANLLSTSTARADNAGFVTMIAVTEAFKLLASAAPPSSAMLFEFNGFACATRSIQQRRACPYCPS